MASVTERYLGATCADSISDILSQNTGLVGQSCAAGSAARVPGGSACIPTRGDLDPLLFTCQGKVDLAIALAGGAPKSMVVTRTAGVVGNAPFGQHLPVAFDSGTLRQRAVRAESFECPSSRGLAPPPVSDPPILTPEGTYVTTTDGCGASSTVVAAEETEDVSDEASSEGWDDSDSSEGCSSEDDSSSSESCSKSPSSSSSSSSGGDDSDTDDDGSDTGDDDGWDTEDDDDGWDTEDEMSPKAAKVRPKPHASRGVKRKPASPVSRLALLGAALLLPLRRRRKDPAHATCSDGKS